MDKENFELVNEQIKSFISSYQENPFITPLKRILSLHKRLIKSVKELEDNYVKEMIEKMDDVLQYVLAGDESMLLSADKDSYHILLWKLHQYLIKDIFDKNKKE